MNALLEQLNLDNTFFVEFVIIAVLFLVLSKVYFEPFLKLFEVRHKRTISDREAAEQLMQQAQNKLEEYKRLLSEERLAARKTYEEALTQAKKQEAIVLAEAREEAKKITQDAADSVNLQRDRLKKQLDSVVEEVAQGISEKLLSRKM